jgi:hypothetical protein
LEIARRTKGEPLLARRKGHEDLDIYAAGEGEEGGGGGGGGDGAGGEDGRRAGRVATPRSGSLLRDQGAEWDPKSAGTNSDDLVDPVAFCGGE